MSIEKKSLISNRTATKKAIVTKPGVSNANATKVHLAKAHPGLTRVHLAKAHPGLTRVHIAKAAPGMTRVHVSKIKTS